MSIKISAHGAARKRKQKRPIGVAVERKATTFRLDPDVQAGLMLLGAVLKNH